MWNVAENNLILLVIALVIGLAVALWLFRGRSAASDGPEGNALHDEFSAATRDVAGEILGVDAHPNIPGPSGPPDNLQRLKGVGPKMAAQLNEFGITRFDQLAGLTENEVALLDKRMGAFEGRIARDRLVEQACYLERGDTDGFEAKFGKLGSA
jgi:predicted flap endonuclease-1-like 5' DNA nuclease